MPKTICEGMSVSSEAPASAANHWSVNLVPTADGVTVKYKRKWNDGSGVHRTSAGTRQLQFGSSSYSSRNILDTVDGGSRVEISLKLGTLRNLDPSSADADRLPEISSDPALATIRAHAQKLDRELADARTKMTDRHPTVMRLQSELALVTEQMRGRRTQIIAALITQYERATVPLAPVDGCNALSASLEAGLTTDHRVDVFEAELWFVHKTPDGKETSQRQAVRLRSGGGGDFYFDDMGLTIKQLAKDLPIAIEVFGSLSTATRPNNTIFTIVNLTRRYVPKDTGSIALGAWPKVGKMAYPIEVTPGEVVSFLLPPLEDDHGMFLGHRFSVRLRIKPLGEGELAARQ
ncbi:MAG: hypothetical protein M3R55_11065 [Acidobacteriota bacterium]|nr:hypothetical protein [Acidobacteriota bacterium]